MAYATPPTFASGTVLAASDLNILGDDIVYLKGLVQTGVAVISASVGPITTTETVVVSYTMPANSAAIGTTYIIKAHGTATSTSATNINMRCRVGPTTLTGGIAGVIQPTASTTSSGADFGLELQLTFRSIGASGTARANGIAWAGGAAASAFGSTYVKLTNTTSNITPDTTVDNLIELTFETGNVNNAVTLTDAIIMLART